MNVEGVIEARADAKAQRAWVKYDPSRTEPQKLVEAINQNTAFKASLPGSPG